MANQEELENLALGYFNYTFPDFTLTGIKVRPSKIQSILVKSRVIKAGDNIVFPLLRRGLEYLQYRATELTTKQQTSVTDPVFAIWLLAASRHMAEALGATFTEIGQSAWDTLCQALLDQKIPVRVLAALILTIDPHPSSRTANNLKSALKNINPIENAIFDSGLLFLLTITLANSGDEQAEVVIADMQKKEKLTRNEYVTKSEITSLTYLAKHGF